MSWGGRCPTGASSGGSAAVGQRSRTGGCHGGGSVSETMKPAADDVESLVLPECGHYPVEEAPEAMLSTLTAFLAPYRDRRPQRTRHGEAKPSGRHRP